jgi:hypothetical protein
MIFGWPERLREGQHQSNGIRRDASFATVSGFTITKALAHS